VTVKAGAICRRVAQANAALFEIGFAVFLQFLHGLTAAAIGAAPARGEGAAFAAGLFLITVFRVVLGALDPSAALGAGLDELRRRRLLGGAGTFPRRWHLLGRFFTDHARTLNRRRRWNVLGPGSRRRRGFALRGRRAAFAIVQCD